MTHDKTGNNVMTATLTYENDQSRNVGAVLYELDWRAVYVFWLFPVDMVQVVDFSQRFLPPLAVWYGVSMQEDVPWPYEELHAAVTEIMLELERDVVRVADVMDDVGHDVRRVLRAGNGTCQQAWLNPTLPHLLQHVCRAVFFTVREVIG